MRLKNAGDPDFDPELEKAKLDAVKIERHLLSFLLLAKEFFTAARQSYLTYRINNIQHFIISGNDEEKWLDLSKEAAVSAVEVYGSMAILTRELDGILKVFGDRFDVQDREDYASISLLVVGLNKNFGQKKWWRLFSKVLSDAELVELGNWLLFQTIKSSYPYGDKIPMEKRQNHIRVFLGLEKAKIPTSCPIRPAGT